jgi:hypothetical protein
MNANELADYNTENSYIGTVTMEDVATMLRQQADLIRNLQKSLGFKNSGYETINLTPQLELTDEEIDNISDEIPHYIDTYMGRRMFARAILIKAQEK